MLWMRNQTIECNRVNVPSEAVDEFPEIRFAWDRSYNRTQARWCIDFSEEYRGCFETEVD